MTDEKPPRPSRCDRCFNAKDVQRMFPGVGITCCKSCRYQLGQTLAFLEYYGLRVVVSEQDDRARSGEDTIMADSVATEETPPSPPDKRRRGDGKSG